MYHHIDVLGRLHVDLHITISCALYHILICFPLWATLQRSRLTTRPNQHRRLQKLLHALRIRALISSLASSEEKRRSHNSTTHQATRQPWAQSWLKKNNFLSTCLFMVSMSYEAEAGRHRHVDNPCSDKLEMTVAGSCPIADSYTQRSKFIFWLTRQCGW